MVEQTVRAKQFAKKHKPSRLRNEVPPESTDDERDSQRHTFQQPYSDTLVPETQLDEIRRFDEHIGGDVEADYTESPLSAADQATIDRLGVVKRFTASKPDQTFELFTKKPSPLCDSAVPSLPRFSFAPPRQALNKTQHKGDAAGPQPASHAAVALTTDEESGKESSNNTTEAIVPQTILLAEFPVNVQHEQQRTNLHRKEESIPSSYLPTSKTEPRHVECSPNETALGQRPPSQPVLKPTNGTTKVRTIRKNKKSNKGLPSQQRGGPWPPRISSTTGHIQKPNDVNQTASEVFADPRCLSQSAAPNDDAHACAEEESVPSLAVQDLQERSPSSGATQGQIHAQHDAPSGHTLKEMPSTMSQGVLDVFAKRTFPSSSQSPTIVTMQHHVAGLGKQYSLVEKNEAVISRCEGAPFDHQPLSSPIQPHDDTVPRANEAVDKEYASQTRTPQTNQNTNFEQPVTQSIGAEAVLHGTIDRGKSDRVAKPRRKPRANSRPISHGFHRPSMSSNFERSMENLRLVMLADTFRMQHDHNVESKHQMETADALREHVELQNETIAGYKQRYQDVQETLRRLTEKAKTNQRFVMGLQKDYEKLQKLTTDAQEHSKKNLHANVAEFEGEKEDLRREFEMTTDKLVQSQKRMKTVVEDLYAQLVVKDSEKKRLAERLTDQEAACAREQKKSEDLETKLLPGIRDLQSQFKNGSTALINRLGLIQTSVEKVAADDSHDIKIKECIEILHSLQASPFLKVQDVSKAESMLRFFRKRMESGMKALSKAIVSDGPSNAVLQSSIQVRLDDLSNKLLKCEEISAENRSIHENNATLIEQLEAYQQNESQLNNHVETLKQVEIDLKARCSQLERDLSDLRDASQSLPLETADSEQIVLELRRQLATANGDLEAVNEKSGSIEQSHRSLENEKAQFNTLLEQIREDAAEEKRKLAEAHRMNIDDWSRRLAETSTTLKEVEAKARISEDQYHAKITADRKVAESKLFAVEQEYRDALRKVQGQNILSRQHSPQGSSEELALPEFDQNNRHAKQRKKVDRSNRSTIEATLEQTHGLQLPSYTLTETSPIQICDFDLFANAHESRLGIGDLWNDGHDYSIADPVPDFISDTQDVGGHSRSQEFFTESLAQATPQQDKRRTTSPTDLSEMGSDELARLQKEVQPVSASKLRGCDALSKPEDSHSTVMAAPVRSDGSHSSHSQECPRSQANTASRMMPSPNSIPHQSQTRDGDRIGRGKITAHHRNYVGTGQKPGSSGTSTPVFVRSEASMFKQTYSHCEPKTSARFKSQDDGHSDKRKMPSGRFDRESASKRQRKPSPTRSIIPSSSIRGRSSYTSTSSATGTRSTKNCSSHTKGVASTSSHNKSQTNSSGIQARTFSFISSPGETHCSRQQRMLQARETSPQRRSSSRVTRSKSRNGTTFGDDFGERFSEELGGRC